MTKLTTSAGCARGGGKDAKPETGSGTGGNSSGGSEADGVATPNVTGALGKQDLTEEYLRSLELKA